MDSNIREMHQTYQLLRQLVKYGMAAIAVLCTIHCGLLLMDYDLLVVHIALCSFLFLLGLYLSRLFRLCWVHKACVIYAYLVVLCIVLKRYGVFGNLEIDISTARITMLFVGLTIISFLLWKVQRMNYLKN
jgi:hypothetical protein